MSYINEYIILNKVIEDFFHILEEGDEAKFLEIWHPEARRFTIGNTLQLCCFKTQEMITYSIHGIKNLKKENPNQGTVKFQVNEIVGVKMFENVIAAAEVKWHSLYANSKGKHHSFIHFAKQNDRWLIVNILDRGYENELENKSQL